MTEKLYWKTPYENEFDAEITDFKNNTVFLNKTLFYPSAGGQFCDIGVIKISNNNYDVVEVQKEGELIAHKIDISENDKKKILIGQKIIGKIDWDYRYAIMKAHTSQHIISAFAKKTFNAETTRAVIGPEEVSLQFSKKITYENLKEITNSVTELFLVNDAKINCSVLPRQEALQEYSDKIRGQLVDDDPLRIVEITKKDSTLWDLMCCGGTHILKSTEIGPIFIFKFNRGVEIKYYVGQKAIKAINNSNVRLLNASNLLNQSIMKIDEVVDKNLNEINSLRQNNKDLSYKFLELLSQNTGTIIKDVDVKIIELSVDRKIITTGFKKFPQKVLLIVKLSPLMIIIVSSSPKVNANELFNALINKFGGKGGGGPKVAQGSLKEIPKDILNIVKEYLE